MRPVPSLGCPASRPAGADVLDSVGRGVGLAAGQAPPPSALPPVAALAAAASGIDWPGRVAERIGLWAGGYFDDGQALWAAPRGNGAYAAWRSFASHDLAPEIQAAIDG